MAFGNKKTSETPKTLPIMTTSVKNEDRQLHGHIETGDWLI